MPAPKRKVTHAVAREHGLRVRVEEDYGGPLRFVDITVPYEVLPADLWPAVQRWAAREHLLAALVDGQEDTLW